MILALNETRKTLLASRIQRIDSSSLRACVVEPIRPGDAVWIEPCDALDVSRRLTSVDLLLLDANHTVVAALQSREPKRLADHLAYATSVLAIAPGTIALTNTCSGDRIAFESIDGGVREARQAVDVGWSTAVKPNRAG